MSKLGWWSGLSTGSKWLIGTLGTGIVGFTTVIGLSGTGGQAKPVVSTPAGVQTVAGQTPATAGGSSGGASSKDKSNKSTPSNSGTAGYGGPGSSGGGGGDGGSLADRMAAHEMNIDALRNDILGIKQTQAAMTEQVLQRIAAMQEESVKAAAARATPPVDLPPLMRPARPNERFSGEYQTKVSHFKGNRGNGWALSDGEFNKLITVASVASAPAEPMTLSVSGGGDVPVTVGTYEYIIPAGSRILAVTEQAVNSDHPGFFTSRVVRPDILRGAHLICQQGGQQNNRIPVEVVKVIFKDAEYTLSGQVENNFPGVTGKINRHYLGRSVPIIANAAITGGFVAWSAKNRGSDRIDTRDAITAEVVSQTLPQIQNEIASFGTPRPPTVEVAAGSQFSILLTNKLSVRY